MQSCLAILQDLAVETVRLPLVSPEGDGDHLSEAIDLQSTGSNCTDDTGIVDDLNLDA